MPSAKRRSDGPDYRGLREKIARDFLRRQDALRNGGIGLVPVCCQVCGRPIATTKVDQARGEPPILFEFPEDAKGWTCWDCSRCPQCGYSFCDCARDAGSAA